MHKDLNMDKATITSHLAIYCYTLIPFGLHNAPATFQRALDTILSGVQWKISLVNIFDVIILSKNNFQHIMDIDEVVARLY